MTSQWPIYVIKFVRFLLVAPFLVYQFSFQLRDEHVAVVLDLKDEKLHNREMLKWKIVCFDLSIYLISLFYISKMEDIDNISP